MATDWAADVKKYVAKADEAAIAGIVRYCGIALRNTDSSLVAFSDKTELDRVRNNFLKKKLGLTQSDAVLDKAIAKVGEVMKADRTKNRVTVYYLLAAEFKQLGLFVKAPAKAAATKAPAKTPAKAAAKAPAATAEAKAPAKKAAAPAKTKTAAKVAGAAAAVAGAAVAAKAPAKKAAAAKPAAKAAAKPAAKPAAKAAAKPAAKKAAPAKKAAAPVKAQGLMDKAADTATDAGKAGTAAVVGTVAAVGAVGAAAVSAASGAADAVKDTAVKAVGAAGDAAGAAASAATGAVGAAADKAGALFATSGEKAASSDEDSGLGWLWWVLGLLLLAFAAWWLFGRATPDAASQGAAPTEAASGADAGTAGSAAAADLTSAPTEGTVAIPAGAGVTSETRDGKPVVKVYFDSGKVDVARAFAPAAGGLKVWLDGHSGSTLAVSGYADPSGNAALNAELAKKRAQAVQAALVAAGIPEASAQLVKPDSVIDSSIAKDAARRVEVVVK